MSRRGRSSHCRQRIAELLEELRRGAQPALGFEPLVRGSLYRLRRRCGKRTCRCAQGRLHRGEAFSVREGGLSRAVAMTGFDREKLARRVAVYRELRKSRALMVRAFGELLKAADQLEGLREIPIDKLRREAAPHRGN